MEIIEDVRAANKWMEENRDKCVGKVSKPSIFAMEQEEFEEAIANFKISANPSSEERGECLEPFQFTFTDRADWNLSFQR